MSTLVSSEIIGKIRDLPSLPVVVMELLGSVDKENMDIKTLADKVSRDQALTAKTLRLANSSFYGMPRKVTTISQAISILGFQSVRTLITAAAVTGNFPVIEQSTFNFRAFWRHALGSAICAKALARHANVNQEYAFMAGLLHDIGRLVLVTFFWKQYDAVVAYRNEHDCYLFEAEHEVLRIDHAMIGQSLAENWKFPEAMQWAVANHHNPEVQENSSLTSIVHIADALAHALDLSEHEDDLMPPLSGIAWKNLDMGEGTILQILNETDKQFAVASQILEA
ncbi:MAG TPA: HDOD domain-containing protein [Burkholderiaceae bacterium]|nr:HDOD domain-containing protein [Burkholderiaceae bacterium]